jgi:hypothetical protein
MKDIHTSIRVSYDNESELYDLITHKGGVKKAINYLFEFYRMYQNKNTMIDEIVSELKKDINFATVAKPIQGTITTSKKKVTESEIIPNGKFVVDDEASMIMSNFIK